MCVFILYFDLNLNKKKKKRAICFLFIILFIESIVAIVRNRRKKRLDSWI